MENIKKGKIDIDRYRVKENEKVNLKKFPTKRDVDIDKEEVKSTFFPEVIEQLKVYQEAVCPEYIRAYYRTAGDGCGRKRRYGQSCFCKSGSRRRFRGIF